MELKEFIENKFDCKFGNAFLEQTLFATSKSQNYNYELQILFLVVEGLGYWQQ